MNIKKPSFKGICLMHIQSLTNFPYIEKDFDAITDYDLLCKVVDYLNQVITNSNEQNAAITSLYDAFIELKDYVDNYFDNNFPELVSDKLDEMAEDGTLENLLNNKLKLITTYHSFTDVIEDKNKLSNGMIIKTLGYYNINDGGAATYYITNTASETEYQEDFENGLYATLIIENNVNVKQLGAYGDGIHDDTQVIQKAIDKFDNIYIPDYEYKITSPLIISSRKLIKCDGIIIYDGNESALKITSGLYSNIYIKQIKSENGGGLLIEPTGSCGNHVIKIDYINTYLESFKVLGKNNNKATCFQLYGILWYSTTSECVKFEIESNSKSYLNQFTFNEMKLSTAMSEGNGIKLINNYGMASDIQVNFNHVNLEGSRGIYTKGHVEMINVVGCRTQELYNIDGWLTFEEYSPRFSLVGAGAIILDKIKFLNITAGQDFTTTYQIVDKNGSYYEGGYISFKKLFYPNQRSLAIYNITDTPHEVGSNFVDDGTANTVPYIYEVNTSEECEIIFSNPYIYFNYLTIIRVRSEVNVTVKRNDGTVFGTLQGKGTYIMYNNGTTIYGFTKLT